MFNLGCWSTPKRLSKLQWSAFVQLSPHVVKRPEVYPCFGGCFYSGASEAGRRDDHADVTFVQPYSCICFLHRRVAGGDARDLSS